MKKVFTAALAFILALALMNGAAAQTASLYEQGLKVISLMREIAGSDAYLSMYSASSELKEIAAAAGGNDDPAPKAVYQLTVSEAGFSSLLETAGADGLSERLRTYAASRMVSALASQLNAAGSANMIAAASICSADSLFVSDEAAGSVLYLYTYENAVPALVAFIAGEDGAVSASGTFLFHEALSADPVPQIELLLSGFPVTIRALER